MQHSDASRNSPNYQYRWSGSTVDWCDATNCYEGGVGDLEQTQTDYTWNFKASSPLFSGDVNYGAELKTIEAQKNRSADYNSFGLQKSPVNDGETDYIGYAVEWSGSYENHRFNANITWSETKSNGQEDYFDYVDPEDENDYLYYSGSLITMSELYDIQGRQNFASPWRAAVSWSANWFNERLLTHAALHYRGAYEYLGRTGEEIKVDGTDYDVYEKLERKAFTTVDLNTKYLFWDAPDSKATLDLRVTNLFNKLPHTDTTAGKRYQMGRAYWVGLSYTL